VAVRPVLRLPATALKAVARPVAGAPAVAREGCMSVPDLTGNVARPARVAVAGTTPEGTRRLVEADAIEARALLHELDHLDGLLFLDRVTSASTDLFRRRRYR
jgi:peptide deformylase